MVRDIKFLTDENVPLTLIKALRVNGFDVKDIKEEKLYGISDVSILTMANKEDRIIITYDKDFLNISRGARIQSKGIVLLKFLNQNPNYVSEKFISVLKSEMSIKFKNSLVIISGSSVEIIK